MNSNKLSLSSVYLTVSELQQNNQKSYIYNQNVKNELISYDTGNFKCEYTGKILIYVNYILQHVSLPKQRHLKRLVNK